MLIRFIALFVSLLVASAQPESRDSSPKDAAVRAPEPATLIDRGAEPREQFRYTLLKGSAFTIEVEMTTHTTDTGADGKQVLDDKRGNRFTLEATVSRVLGDGSVHLSTRTTKFDRLDGEGKLLEPKGIEALALDMLRSASGSCIVGPDGQVRSATVGDGTHANFTEMMFQPISFAFAPLPREAVGLNSRWTSTAPAFRDTKILKPKAAVPDDSEHDTLQKAGEVIEVSRTREHAEAPEAFGGNFLYDGTKNLTVTIETTTRLATADGLIPQSALAVRTFDADATNKGTPVHTHISTRWSIKVTPAAQPPGTEASKDAPAPTLKLNLLDPGSEPRAALAAAPQVGERAVYEAVIHGREGIVDEIDPTPTNEGPWLSVQFEVAITELTPEETRCGVRVIAASLLNRETLRDKDRKAFEDEVQPCIGKSYAWRTPTKTGAVIEKFLPDDAPEFLAILGSLRPNLPDAHVGRGARWFVGFSDLPNRDDARIHSRIEYRLLTESAGLWTVEKNESLFATQARGPNGGLSSVTTTATATMQLRPGSLLPDELHQSMSVVIKDSKLAKLGQMLRKESSIYLVRKPEAAANGK